jgi:hypothetical protein
MIGKLRKNGNFVIISIMMATVIAVISSIRQEALASMISSKFVKGMSSEISQDDLETVQHFLESRIVIQKLSDFGMEKEEAMAKVSDLNPEDLHTLASMINKAPAGGDGVGILIGLAVLALIVIIIIKLLDKEIIIK